MGMLVGVGSSTQKNPLDAVAESYFQALQSLETHSPGFILLFVSSTAYDQQLLLAALKTRCPEAVIVGCSTSGEITTDGSIDYSVALMAVYSDTIQFVSALGTNVHADAKAAGVEFAKKILLAAEGKVPRTALIFPDGLTGNGSEIVKGVLEVFGANFPFVGGSAGDDYQFKKTYQYIDKQLVSDSVVGVGIYGNFSFGIGVRHGWVPIGTSKIATKTKGNLLYELDGKPAISIYKEQFGEKVIVSGTEPFAQLAVTYPLGIPAPNKDGYLVRDPITVDENGVITCAAEIPQGSEVFMMIGNQEEAINAACDAAKQAMAQVAGKTIKAVILFNCIARKKLFMQKKQEEIERIRDIIGRDVPLIGFYTYGEQAPLGGGTVSCTFHNETDVLFILAQ